MPEIMFPLLILVVKYVLYIKYDIYFQDRLPITSFLYGLMYLNHQNATVKIGPLICRGTKPNRTLGASCQSWKTFGMPSGYYPVEQRPHIKSKYSIENLSIYYINFYFESLFTSKSMQ